MSTVGINIKPDDARAVELARKLVGWLKERGCGCIIADRSLDGQASLPLGRLPAAVDLMVALGGDGTLLHVARRFIGASAPIVGINLGRLGFLTDAPAGNMFEVVGQALEGRAVIERRFTLQAEGWRGSQRLTSGVAVNDVVLQRSAHPRMIAFEMLIGGRFVFHLRADGLVLATPTGSTAYALSAGGPIVHPSLLAVSVVPICPHTLSNRPIVVPADDTIELRVTECPADAALNLDGQEHLVLREGDRVLVSRGGMVSLAFPSDRNYYEVLRSKLHWVGPGKPC